MNSTNIKIKYVIHLLKLDLCNVQYVGKSETAFNICLNSLRKDVKDPNALPADKHFTLPGHDFNNNAKFSLIEMLTKSNQVITETLK